MFSILFQKCGLPSVCALLLCISCVVAEIGEFKYLNISEKQIDTERDPKLFAFAPFVRVTNRVCGPEDNRGSCYSEKNCTSRGGTALPGISCANGFGVCCSVMKSCAMGNRRVSTSEKVVTLSSAMGVSSCVFTVARNEPDVCQLQVDLTEFNLGMGPDIRGNCQQASLTISDSVTVASNFKLCGQQSGRRLFLTYDEGPGSVIDFDFRSNNVQISHKLRITQIKCIDKKVPDNCLEYYDETQPNRVTSFGHPMYMINNPIYNICVDSPTSANGIEWEPCLENPVANQTFRLSPWFSDMTGGKQVPLSGYQNCAGTTFVEIVGGDRHCGARLKILPNDPPITSMVKPFTLAVSVVPYSHATLNPSYLFRYPSVPPADPVMCSDLGMAMGVNVRAFDLCAMVGTVAPAPVLAQAYCNCPRSVPPTTGTPPGFPEPLQTPNPPRTGFCLMYNII